MRFVTETRLKLLEELLGTIPDPDDRSYALHLLNSIRADIDENYAEIGRPIRVTGLNRQAEDKPSSVVILDNEPFRT
jgi:hypothetical protein